LPVLYAPHGFAFDFDSLLGLRFRSFDCSPAFLLRYVWLPFTFTAVRSRCWITVATFCIPVGYVYVRSIGYRYVRCLPFGSVRSFGLHCYRTYVLRLVRSIRYGWFRFG
jgi:hypothetical protein